MTTQDESNDNDMLQEILDVRKIRDAEIPSSEETSENKLMSPIAGKDE